MTLLFDPSAHRYTWNGQPVPSVTQILAPLRDLSRIPPGVLAAKRALGVAVHACCELDDFNDLDESTVLPEWAPYLAAYRRFKTECEPVWSHIEARVFHSKLLYAGTLDRFGTILTKNARNATVDLKCTAEISAVTGPQTAAYTAALKDMKLVRANAQVDRYTLLLKPDGTYVFEPHTETADFAIFTSLLAVRNWIAKHNIDVSLFTTE